MGDKPRTLLVFSRSNRQRLNVSGYFAMAPIGIATLAACLRNAGYPVDLIDAHVFPGGDEAILRQAREKRYGHVGFSANFFSAEYAIRMADRIRSALPDAVISLGGPAGWLDPDELIKYSLALDLICTGDGEGVVVDVARAIENGADLRGIPGTIRHRDGALETTDDDHPMNMDDAPRPLLEMLPLASYRIHPPFGVYPPAQYCETARGCPLNCMFCSLPKTIRMRSPALVVEDVAGLKANYGVREVHFVDPTFTFDRNRVRQICEGLIQSGLDVHWTCKTRCDLVDRETLEAMARSGCYSISFGGESASQEMLDYYQKDLRVEHLETAFFETKRAGIRVLAYMLVGSPGETDETVRQSMRLMRKYKPDFVLYAQLLPDPGRKHTRDSITEAHFTKKEIFDFYLAGKRDLFKEKGLLGTPSRQINKWILRAFFDFYARPSYIVQRLSDIRSWADFTNYVRAAWVLAADLLGWNRTVG